MTAFAPKLQVVSASLAVASLLLFHALLPGQAAQGIAARSPAGAGGGTSPNSVGKAGGGAAPALPAAASLEGPVVIPLSRVSARTPLGQAGFYVSRLTVGNPPQVLQVMFDTSSGDLLLPHRACRSPSCLRHRRYSPWESTTALDINADGHAVPGLAAGKRLARGKVVRDVVTVNFTQADLGEGAVKAVLVRDTVCVGGAGAAGACVDMGLLAALTMEDKPFGQMPSDGIVGLGLSSLTTGAMSSFLGRLFMSSKNILPQFGISLRGDRGQVHIGSHSAAHFEGSLRWLPVARPADGFWQVAILAVRVGNVTVDDCRRGCRGIVDTGVSRLGAHASRVPALRRSLASSPGSSSGLCSGPDLVFDLGSMALTLQAQDYAGADCTPLLGPVDVDGPGATGVYALGEPVLRSYYAAFDWEKHMMGFAPLTTDRPIAQRSKSIPDAYAGVLLI